MSRGLRGLYLGFEDEDIEEWEWIIVNNPLAHLRIRSLEFHGIRGLFVS
jgi:hypothetical protein